MLTKRKLVYAMLLFVFAILNIVVWQLCGTTKQQEASLQGVTVEEFRRRGLLYWQNLTSTEACTSSLRGPVRDCTANHLVFHYGQDGFLVALKRHSQMVDLQQSSSRLNFYVSEGSERHLSKQCIEHTLSATELLYSCVTIRSKSTNSIRVSSFHYDAILGSLRHYINNEHLGSELYIDTQGRAQSKSIYASKQQPISIQYTYAKRYLRQTVHINSMKETQPIFYQTQILDAFANPVVMKQQRLGVQKQYKVEISYY